MHMTHMAVSTLSLNSSYPGTMLCMIIIFLLIIIIESVQWQHQESSPCPSYDEVPGYPVPGYLLVLLQGAVSAETDELKNVVKSYFTNF